MRIPRQEAFTLAEVLIALALLGVVAAFAIPKVLQSVEDTKKRALFRETLASLHAIQEEARLSGALTTTFADYFFKRFNAVKTCPSATAGGCWSGVSPTNDPTNEITQEGAVLPNGVTLCGFDSTRPYSATGFYYNGIMVDWNGTKPPNIMGNDQLWLIVCYGTAPCTSIVPNLMPGKILPPIPGVGTCNTAACIPETADNVQLYNWVVQN